MLNTPVGSDFNKIFTPLQLAASKNVNYDVIRTLIRYGGADVNSKEGSPPPPLIIAVMKQDPPTLVKLLLDSGADVMITAASNDSSRCYINPLTAAGSKGNIEIGKILIQYGARVDESGGDNLITPYHSAAMFGHINFLKFLMDIHHDPNIIGCYRKTPLFSALEANLDTVKFLVEAGGADVNAMDETGTTPLTYAAAKKKRDIMAYLIQHGAIAMYKGQQIK